MSRDVEIHPTAVVHPEAKIGDRVKIGPYCVVSANTQLGNDNTLHSHVILDGHLEIGDNNSFFQFCSIGAPPQDLGYKNEPTRTVIGSNNVFREYVSVHRGTLKQDHITIIGSHGLFMAHAHVGHDVVIGDRVILVNSVNLAGHVNIGDKTIISGGTNVSQFVTIGSGAFIGGLSGVDRDIPPFCAAYGNRIRLKGINIVGLRRQGHSKQEISELVDFYRTMESSALSSRAFVDHKEFVQDFAQNSLVQKLSEFIRKSEIGIAPFIS